MAKFKTILYVIVIGLMLVSCGGDDEDNSTQSVENRTKILGLWTLTKTSTNGVIDDNSATCKLYNTLNFQQNTVVVNIVSGVDCTTTQSTLEDYSINGNVLKVGDVTVDIKTLNSTTLKVRYRGENYEETYSK